MSDAVVSYNMSYASDLGINVEKATENALNFIASPQGKVFLFSPSELIFLQKYANPKPRSAWLKAFDYLQNTIIPMNPSIVGLQELNRWHNYPEQFTSKDSSPGEFVDSGNYATSTTSSGIRGFLDVFRNDAPKSLGYSTYEAVLPSPSTPETDKTADWEAKNSEKWDGPKGVEAIVEMLRVKPNYKYFHGEADETGIGRFTVMTIWDSEKLGQFHAGQVFSATDASTSKNRPLLFVVTKKGEDYSLIMNIHGKNDPSDSAGSYQKNKAYINTQYEIFKTNLGGITITNYYVVGDFNDPFGGFFEETSKTKFRNRTAPDDANKVTGIFKSLDIPLGPFAGEFKIGETLLTFTSDNAPTSCCYNWDSTKNMATFGEGETIDNYVLQDTNALRLTMSGSKPKDPKKTKHIITPEERGKPDNYFYPGDYCFSNRGGKLSVLSAPQGLSDHQPVMLTISDPTAGQGTPGVGQGTPGVGQGTPGGRKRRTKRKINKTRRFKRRNSSRRKRKNRR